MAADHLLLEYSSARRCRPLDGARYFATLLNFTDARLGHAETTELLGGAIDHRHLVRIAHGTGCLDGERILQLRLHQGRAVETKERLTRFHRIAGRIDMQFLDVPLRPKGDDRQLSLIDAYDARRADRPNHSSQLHFFDTDAAPLDSIQAHLDGVVVVLIIAFVDRDIVHPHRIFLGNRRCVRQSHWIPVVQNPLRTGR